MSYSAHRNSRRTQAANRARTQRKHSRVFNENARRKALAEASLLAQLQVLEGTDPAGEARRRNVRNSLRHNHPETMAAFEAQQQ